MSRIICIGNRYVDIDDFGARVHDVLKTLPLAAGIEVVDGGLAGLGLLRYLEDGRAAVFVDNVEGFADAGELVELDDQALAALPPQPYGHEAGIAFLVRILPQVTERPPAAIRLIGCEGRASDEQVVRAAARSLELAGALQ